MRLGDPRPALALRRQLGDAGLAHFHDGEFRDHEERVDDDQQDDADDFERRGIHRESTRGSACRVCGLGKLWEVSILLSTSIA